MTNCPLLNTLWLESELFRTWAAKAFGKSPFATMARTQLHVHHIFGGKTRKDLPSNTITVCAAVHEFCHAHQTEGRIACLWWKLKAGEIDWSDLEAAAGYSVTGWLHMNSEATTEPFESWRSDVYHAGMLDAERRRPATAR